MNGASGLVIGIDLATSGARVHVVDLEDGGELLRVAAPLPEPRLERGVRVQDAAYATVALELLGRAMTALGARRGEVRAVCITGTSGTVVPVDSDGRPTGAAVLYNDTSTAGLERVIAEAGVTRPAGMLARIGGLVAGGDVTRIASTADVVAAALLGRAVPIDVSHALKAAIDPVLPDWDAVALEAGGIDRTVLPGIVASGTVLGEVAGGPLPEGTLVIAGMTDGCTSQIATGAVGLGSSVGVLGTTLVLKAVASAEVIDTGRGVYSHRSPDGLWWSGGASNVGSASLAALVPSSIGREQESDREAWAAGPAAVALYPLPAVGERFPWAEAAAKATWVGTEPRAEPERMRAVLEGVALVERWGLEVLADRGVAPGTHTVSGGAAASTVWNTLRASALGRPVRVALTRDSGFGAAVLAAAAVTGEPLHALAARFARLGAEIEPDPALVDGLDDRYHALREAIDR